MDEIALPTSSMNEIVGDIQGIEDIPFEYENEDNEYEYSGEEDVHETVVGEYDEGVFLSGDDEEEEEDDVDNEEFNEENVASDEEGRVMNVDSVGDIGKFDLGRFGADEVVNVNFISVEVACFFYTLYARVKGFAVRKSKIHKDKNGVIVQQCFVCNREGFKEDKGLSIEQRKRKSRKQTRCGCKAQLRVHVDKESMRWYVSYFNDEHNHKLLVPKYVGMLPAFRKMSESDLLEMNYYKNAGIAPNLMYGSFACQSGGYENIGFSQKNIYNQIGKERRKHGSDAKGCLDFLYGLGGSDPMMFVSHTVDGDGRMEHLFWSDGNSQNDYKVFGDVLAFDATYGRNKYRCPVVVFSGVNHHKQTIVFAAAIVANETEQTYIWLLNEFLKAMKGKAPAAVITDGDAAMRNAIRNVFPNAHHRLCAWHLSRNANSNVGIPAFTSEFTFCMLGDLDVGEFKRKWGYMVEKFGLHDNAWVAQTYEKRKMWAVAYMRGKFFGGFRTTSRCEGLNAQIGRYVKSRYSLMEFVHHFSRCVNHMRFKEHEADFASHYGESVLETEFHNLERSGSLVYTRDVFSMYCRVLSKCSCMAIVAVREVSNYNMFVVERNGGPDKKWFVSYYPATFDFKCACLKMESVGIPCEHILAVLIYLNIGKLPKSLVLNRWTKCAKDLTVGMTSGGTSSWSSQLICRYAVLMQQYRELATLACKHFEFYCIEREKNRISIEEYRSKLELLDMGNTCTTANVEHGIRDPNRVASKGRNGTVASSSGLKSKRKIRCSFCKIYGHNKKSCKPYKRYLGTVGSQSETYLPWVEDETPHVTEEFDG